MRKDLMENLGIGPTDGILLAWIPVFDQVPTTEGFLGHDFFVWETQSGYMLVDSTDPLRWWQIKSAARNLGYDHPEPVWSGQASELSVECIPELDRTAEGLQLAIRTYHHGPWLTKFKEFI
jgi:hypothetical protein